MRSWTTPSYTSALAGGGWLVRGRCFVGQDGARQRLARETGQTGNTGRSGAARAARARRTTRAAESAGEGPHQLSLNICEGLVRIAAGGDNEVGNRSRSLGRIAGVDGFLGDGQVH